MQANTCYEILQHFICSLDISTRMAIMLHIKLSANLQIFLTYFHLFHHLCTRKLLVTKFIEVHSGSYIVHSLHNF